MFANPASLAGSYWRAPPMKLICTVTSGSAVFSATTSCAPFSNVVVVHVGMRSSGSRPGLGITLRLNGEPASSCAAAVAAGNVLASNASAATAVRRL